MKILKKISRWNLKFKEILKKYKSEIDLEILKTEFPDKWHFLGKKLACSYEHFNSTDDQQKTINNLRMDYSFSKLGNASSGDEKVERTKKFLKYLFLKTENI